MTFRPHAAFVTFINRTRYTRLFAALMLAAFISDGHLPAQVPPPKDAGALAPASTTPATDDAASKDWEARAIVGFHQAGASSASYTQNFFFDFYIARALSESHLWGTRERVTDKETGHWKNRWNLWGDVRISSTPQQVTSGIGTFVSDFATQVSNLPVNQLAQSADFQTGMEYRLNTWVLSANKAGNDGTKPVVGYRTIGLVADFGAMGSFESPDKQMQICRWILLRRYVTISSISPSAWMPSPRRASVLFSPTAFLTSMRAYV
jgi:hypothetical protein